MCKDEKGWKMGAAAALKALWGTNTHVEVQSKLHLENDLTDVGEGLFAPQLRSIAKMETQARLLQEELDSVPAALARIVEDI